MDDTPRRLDFVESGECECESTQVSEGAALLAAVMAEVSTPSQYTGVTDLTHRLGLARPDMIEHTPCSVFQPETSHVEVADADASFESSEGDRSVSYRDELEAAAAAGERVFTPTLARAMRRVTEAAAGSESPASASTVSAHTTVLKCNVRQGSHTGRVEVGANDERRVSSLADVRGAHQTAKGTRGAAAAATGGDRGWDPVRWWLADRV